MAGLGSSCARFGTTRAYPLRALVGIRYPDKAAFCQALQTHADLARAALDDTFWHHTDTGYRRFLEDFAWLLPYREDLVDYEQLLAQSKRIQSHLKATGPQPLGPEWRTGSSPGTL